MNDHKEYISCIKDGVTGTCRDIKDKKAQEMIATLENSLTSLQQIVNNITGTSSDLVTDKEFYQVVSNITANMGELASVKANKNDVEQLESNLEQLESNKADLTNERQEITAQKVTTSNLIADNLYVSGGFIYGNASDDGILEFQFMSPTDTGYRTAHFSTDTFQCNKIGFTQLDYISKKVLLDFSHPVNSIIEIEDDTFDPNVYYAGTGSEWERLPDGYVLWSASSGAGTTIPAGLPNITGSFEIRGSANGASNLDHTSQGVGSFTKMPTVTNYPFTGTSNRYDGFNGYNFDANNGASVKGIYGNSTTVQPPARKTCMWKRIA